MKFFIKNPLHITILGSLGAVPLLATHFAHMTNFFIEAFLAYSLATHLIKKGTNSITSLPIHALSVEMLDSSSISFPTNFSCLNLLLYLLLFPLFICNHPLTY